MGPGITCGMHGTRLGTVVILGGRVIDPASGLDRVADVVIERGRVAAIGPGVGAGAGAGGGGGVVIEAAGLIVAPGLIDPHVHLREPGGEHKETIETGTAAAVAGGFTSVCCMPNTAPAIDTPEMVRAVLRRAEEVGRCRVFPVSAGTVGRGGERPSEIGLCARAGAVGISDDGEAIASAGVMARVLELCAGAGVAFMQHCQEPTMTRGAAMHAGAVSARLGLGGWPRAAEELIIERDVRLVAAGGGRARYHVQHMSSAGSVEIVRRARLAGLDVTAEVSPHHLTLTDGAVCGSGPVAGGNGAGGGGDGGCAYDTAAKMNPPLREWSDVEALRAAVAEGVVTVLATDHAPHTADEKAVPFEEAPFGIIGLETAVGLYAGALVGTGLIGWPRLIWLMTVGPAVLCGLDRLGLGALAVGGPGDVTLIDPGLEWVVGESDLAGRSRNTPFLGHRLRGRAVGTVVGGVVAWRHGSLRANRELG